jgi:hypothetical protein
MSFTYREKKLQRRELEISVMRERERETEEKRVRLLIRVWDSAAETAAAAAT